jgi:hypothetical protein
MGYLVEDVGQPSVGWEELVEATKPFAISKWAVWEAYLKVEANRGAAGVDEQSIAQFEQSLKGNLYKLWNRMEDVPLGVEFWLRPPC